MKNLFKASIAACIVFSAFSCKKEITKETAIVQNQLSNESIDDATNSCNPKWLGYYYNGDTGDSVKASNMKYISGGAAKLDNSPWSYYYSSLYLKIPGCHGISGDSTKLVVRLKNPNTDPHAVYPEDVSLWLYGSKNTAHVQFLSFYVQFTALLVGNFGITNDSAFLHLFQDWTSLSLIAKNDKLTVKMGNVTVKTINYSGLKIGKLNRIQIGFKGPGSVDWVKIYNSNTNAQLMQEDFNVDGHSSVVWY